MLTFFCFYVGPLLLPAQWKTMFSTLPWISSGFVSLKGVIFQLSLSSFPLFRQSSDTYLRILTVTQPVDLKTHCLLHCWGFWRSPLHHLCWDTPAPSSLLRTLPPSHTRGEWSQASLMLSSSLGSSPNINCIDTIQCDFRARSLSWFPLTFYSFSSNCKCQLSGWALIIALPGLAFHREEIESAFVPSCY